MSRKSKFKMPTDSMTLEILRSWNVDTRAYSKMLKKWVKQKPLKVS